MTLAAIMQSIGGGTGLLIILTGLIEFTPIKINPWSAVAKKLGDSFNHDLKEQINQTNERLSAQIQDVIKRQEDMERAMSARDADQARSRILKFADELRRGVPHSEEFFNQVLADLHDYESYCADHPEYKNDRCKCACHKIRESYEERLEKNDFL